MNSDLYFGLKGPRFRHAEQAYRELWFTLIDVPAGPLDIRAALVREDVDSVQRACVAILAP